MPALQWFVTWGAIQIYQMNERSMLCTTLALFSASYDVTTNCKTIRLYDIISPCASLHGNRVGQKVGEHYALVYTTSCYWQRRQMEENGPHTKNGRTTRVGMRSRCRIGRPSLLRHPMPKDGRKEGDRDARCAAERPSVRRCHRITAVTRRWSGWRWHWRTLGASADSGRAGQRAVGDVYGRRRQAVTPANNDQSTGKDIYRPHRQHSLSVCLFVCLSLQWIHYRSPPYWRTFLLPKCQRCSSSSSSVDKNHTSCTMRCDAHAFPFLEVNYNSTVANHRVPADDKVDTRDRFEYRISHKKIQHSCTISCGVRVKKTNYGSNRERWMEEFS